MDVSANKSATFAVALLYVPAMNSFRFQLNNPFLRQDRQVEDPFLRPSSPIRLEEKTTQARLQGSVNEGGLAKDEVIIGMYRDGEQSRDWLRFRTKEKEG